MRGLKVVKRKYKYRKKKKKSKSMTRYFLKELIWAIKQTVMDVKEGNYKRAIIAVLLALFIVLVLYFMNHMRREVIKSIRAIPVASYQNESR